MRMIKLFLFVFFGLGVMPCFAADSLFFEDEPIQDGLNVFEMSDTFAEIYEKLDGVKWGGKNINVAIESLEKLNPDAHIAATMTGLFWFGAMQLLQIIRVQNPGIGMGLVKLQLHWF